MAGSNGVLHADGLQNLRLDKVVERSRMSMA
jgi:hypothetical protein